MSFKAHGSGNLAQDPEIKHTKSGKKVCEMVLISNRRKEGEKDAITCVLWEKQAEVAVKYLKKGMRPHVDGYLRRDVYTDNNGARRSITRIFVTELELPPKGSAPAPQVPSQDESAQEILNSEIPF